MRTSHIAAILDEGRLKPFVMLIANGLAQALVVVAMALLVKDVFDKVINEPEMVGEIMTHHGYWLLLCVGLSAALRHFERVLAESLGQNYAHSIRLAVYDRLAILSPRALGRQSRGAILLRFIGDLTALRQWISMGLARLVVAGTTSLLTLILLAILAPSLALIVGTVLLFGASLAILSGKPLERAVRESRRRRVHIANNISEKLNAMAVVRAFGRQVSERKKLERQSRLLKQAMMKRAHMIGLLRALVQSVTGLATIGALLVGVYDISHGQATPGMVVAAMTLVAMLTPPLRDLGRVYELWQAANLSLQKIEQLMQASPLVEQHAKARSLKKGGGALRFENIRIRGILKTLSAQAQTGEHVALVGPNGSGKSSLLMLAARLDDPDKGKVILDGQNIKQLKLSHLAKAVGIVSPDLPLMRGTIASNIRLRMERASAEDVAKALEMAGAADMVRALPLGLNTPVKEGGKNFSLGERQRLQLARAIIGHPRLLLLDEADTNLDPEGVKAFDHLLDHFKATIIMVSHNPTWIRKADTVWHMDHGRLTQVTTPALYLSNQTVDVITLMNMREGGVT